MWTDAIELAARVYENFRKCKDWEFRGQIRSAAVSVSSNIAEGYERDANADFIRFPDMERGACGEVRSQAYLAVRLNLLSAEAGKLLIEEARRLSRRIGRRMDVRRTQFA